MSLLDILSQKAEAMKALEKQFQLTVQGQLTSIFQEVFNLVPQLHEITWSQYTPYFNDGDTCTFGIREVYFGLNPDLLVNVTVSGHDEVSKYTTYTGDDGDYNYEEDNPRYVGSYDFDELTYDKKPNPRYATLIALGITPEGINAMKKLDSFINQNDNIMEGAFGDHAKIIITRDGTHVEEYEHD